MNWKSIFALIFSPRKLCLQNVVGPRADIIRAGLQRTSTILKAFTTGSFACITFYVVVPLKSYFVDNEWVSLLPLEVVFCDQSTFTGFVAANFVQAYMGTIAILATIMSGSGFLICVCNYIWQVDLIGQDFHDLDEMWNGIKTVSTTYYRHAYLRNIFKKRQDLNKYVSKIF